LLNRDRFVDYEIEKNVTSDIYDMIRVKIASDKNSEIEDVELVKKSKTVSDNLVNEFYGNLQKKLGSQTPSLDITLAEIKMIFSNLLNNEAEALKVTDVLHRENSVTEFKDLKRVTENDYYNLLKKNTNLSEQDIEKVVKSILASLA
jgi:hypothetical protein